MKWFNPNHVKDLNQVSKRIDIQTGLWVFHWLHHDIINFKRWELIS